MADTQQFIKVLRKMLKTLSELNDQELQDILEGRADFICTLKDAKTKSTQVKIKAPVDEAAMSEWRDKLYSFNSTAEGVQYFQSLGKSFTINTLKALGDYLGSPLPSRGKKDELIVWLVEHTLGVALNRKGIRQS